MAELKTKANKTSVKNFLADVSAERRADCNAVAKMMRDATGAPAKMWGDTIVVFGCYTYRYASGRGGNWPLVGFSPRKQYFAIYIMPGFASFVELMAKLGKHKTGKSCLYVKSLADIDLKVLEKLVNDSVKAMKKKYPAEAT